LLVRLAPRFCTSLSLSPALQLPVPVQAHYHQHRDFRSSTTSVSPTATGSNSASTVSSTTSSSTSSPAPASMAWLSVSSLPSSRASKPDHPLLPQTKDATWITLPLDGLSSTHWEVDTYLSLASSAGYKYAGVGYGRKCWVFCYFSLLVGETPI
jgi:hypothetical protein